MMTNPFWQALLTPGLKIKRWILIGVLGIAAISYGTASLLRGFLFRPNMAGSEIILAITLQWIPNPYRDIGLVTLGLTITLVSFVALIRALTAPFTVPRSSREWARALVLYQQLRSGPSTTILGNGGNLLAALQSLKLITGNLTAVFIPESTDNWQDFNSVLNAARPYIFMLANPDSMMEQILSQPVPDGHPATVGDILLSTAASTTGDIEAGLRGISKILALGGQVVPAVRWDEIRRTHRPSHEAVCALMDSDLLILAPNALEDLEAVFVGYPPLLSAVKLSRAVRIALVPPKSVHEQVSEALATYLEALTNLFGKNIVHFVLVGGAADPRQEMQHNLKVSQDAKGIRVIHIPVADPAETTDYNLLELAEALLSLHQRFAIRHRRHWRI